MAINVELRWAILREILSEIYVVWEVLRNIKNFRFDNSTLSLFEILFNDAASTPPWLILTRFYVLWKPNLIWDVFYLNRNGFNTKLVIVKCLLTIYAKFNQQHIIIKRI